MEKYHFVSEVFETLVQFIDYNEEPRDLKNTELIESWKSDKPGCPKDSPEILRNERKKTFCGIKSFVDHNFI